MLYIENGLDPTPPLTHARILWQQAEPFTLTASAAVPGTFAQALNTPFFYESWRPAAMPATIEHEFIAAPTINAVYIAGHNMGTLRSQGSPVLVQVVINGSTIMQKVPHDDTALLFLFAERQVESLQIIISGDVAPTISVVKSGRTLDLQRPIFGGVEPPRLNEAVTLDTNLSRNGLPVGSRVRARGASTSYQFEHLKDLWVRDKMERFLAVMRRGGFAAIAWRPAKFPDVSYGSISAASASNMSIRDYMQVQFTFDAVGPQTSVDVDDVLLFGTFRAGMPGVTAGSGATANKQLLNL